MHNAAARKTVKIFTPSQLSLLEQLIAAAGAPLPAPPVCPEVAAVAAPCCSGNGTTLSTYLAPRETYWALDYAGEDFEVGRTYFFRCR